jgi:hypothetical protein
VLSGLFVYVAVMMVVALIGNRMEGADDPWWIIPVIVSAGVVATTLAMFIFNRRFDRPRLLPRSFAEDLREMERAGLLERTMYRAAQAFTVEDPRTGSPRYFVELDDGRVLSLVGDYLFDFEPLDDENGETRPRLFPAECFEILRRKDGGWVIDIRPLGRVFEPELEPDDAARAIRDRDCPGDGEIITDQTYDELRRDWGLDAASRPCA